MQIINNLGAFQNSIQILNYWAQKYFIFWEERAPSRENGREREQINMHCKIHWGPPPNSCCSPGVFFVPDRTAPCGISSAYDLALEAAHPRQFWILGYSSPFFQIDGRRVRIVLNSWVQLPRASTGDASCNIKIRYGRISRKKLGPELIRPHVNDYTVKTTRKNQKFQINNLEFEHS